LALTHKANSLFPAGAVGGAEQAKKRPSKPLKKSKNKKTRKKRIGKNHFLVEPVVGHTQEHVSHQRRNEQPGEEREGEPLIELGGCLHGVPRGAWLIWFEREKSEIFPTFFGF
jgi:hypothetical protein